MGNLQTNEPKQVSKSSKAKVKSLIKIRGGKRGKIDSSQFVNIVPHQIEESLVSTATTTRNESDTVIVTDSWCKVNKINDKKIKTPVSSSSDSNFSDPLTITPVAFNTEMNQCYYSEESVNLEVEVPNSTTHEDFLHNLALNSFKLNEYRARHEEEKTKKLSKLGVSKTSQISLDSDPKECFVSGNVEIVNEKLDGTLKRKAHGDDGQHVAQLVKRMSDLNLTNGHPEYKRHMSVPTEPTTEGIVLKKVTSLILNKSELDVKITKPKFVPEKLDFQLYEKFEGHMLINWYLSEFNEDYQLNSQDLKLLAVQFCTHLLAAGVLRQLPDKDVPTYSIFQPDCIYYWTHAETPLSVPQTPGRLSTVSWPPTSPSDAFVSPSSDILSGFSANILDHQNEKLHQEFRSSARDVEVLALEEEINRLSQEIEKYKTMMGIQNLTARAVTDFSTPIHHDNSCDNFDKFIQTDFSLAQISILTQTDNDMCHKSVCTSPSLNMTIEQLLCDQNTSFLDLSEIDSGTVPTLHLVPDLSSVSIPELSVPLPSPMPEIHAPCPPPMPDLSVPPPPPMPGVNAPCPPPMPDLSVPPPPPMPGVNAPLPPPMPGAVPLPPAMPGATSVPPPPPIPGGPVPLPPPPLGGWSGQKAGLRKPSLNPQVPMKPLYWTRILTPIETAAPVLWKQIDELPLDSLPEFADLFSRQVINRKPTVKKQQQKTKIEPIKLLDSKRSQNVGILAQSLHVEFQEIENAIYHFDTSIVSLEALQQIYEVRANFEELSLIKTHLASTPAVPLDKPEQFLHDLSTISNFAERISCLMFQVEFGDAISTIEHTLTNIKTTCDFLVSNSELKEVLAIILTLGNYMNGGNISRGQADGFGLEILPKLKDVKSKDSKTTLLHYIVQVYMKKIQNPFDGNSQIPVPEPGDIRRAASVNFDEVKIDLTKLEKQLSECGEKTEQVIDNSTVDNLQPFKDKMTTFLEYSHKQLTNEFEHLEECKMKFLTTIQFYCIKPKSGSLEEYPPNLFFEFWLQFCIDFKDIFKKVLLRLEKEKIQELKQKENERNSETVRIKKRENGLKSKVKKLQAKYASSEIETS